MKTIRYTCVFTIAAATLFAADTNKVVYWNQIASDSLQRTDPINASRIYAMTQIAVHDALNSIDRRYQTYAYHQTVDRNSVAEAAIAAASYGVLATMLPAEKAKLDVAYMMALQAIPDSPQKTSGVRTGQAASAAIVAQRQNDGSAREVKVPTGSQPGEYQPTPPLFLPPFLPQWGGVTPFALRTASQFRPPAPPRLDSARYASDLAEVKALGRDTSTIRTEEQSAIAKHWYENTTDGWNRIARTVAEPLGAWEAARLLALVNIALADGFIGGMEAKYHYYFWRPVTAIGDPNWTPFLETPPVPDYPSTHSVLGAAAAAVLARFCGTDMIAFEHVSTTGPKRSYWSFSDAAHENAMSRVMAGIHFRTASQAGLEQGEATGEFVYSEVLRPIQ